MTNQDLLELGFKELPHMTIGNAVQYNLGRGRFLSANSMGTPNEILFICKLDEEDEKKITDAVCIHNYDYDGYLTREKLVSLITALSGITLVTPSIH